MSLQPYQPPPPSKPMGLNRQQRSDITYATEVENFYQQFDTTMLALRLTNAFRLRMMQMELHVQLGDQIYDYLIDHDNPVTAYAIKSAFDEWITVSNQILGRLA